MSEPFCEKLSLVLKLLSLSRGRLAADLGVHKSIVGRWVTGSVNPSTHNLSQLSALVARHSPGFTTFDWDRPLDELAELFGADGNRQVPVSVRGGLPLPLLGQALAMTAQWGAAYEGFYRTTRPFAMYPGQFVHDQCIVRKDGTGMLRLNLANGGVFIDAWLLPLKEQIFVIGSQFSNGTMIFGLLNGVRSARVDRLDGLILSPIQDIGQTPTATAIILERTGDLSGDRFADEAHFAELAGLDPLAPEGSIPQSVRDHLTRDIGPAALAAGGDWLLRMPAERSLASGEPHPQTLRALGMVKASAAASQT